MTSSRYTLLFVLLIAVLTACSSRGSITPTIQPTLTLIAATPRPTATPITPTPTIPVRIDPDDLNEPVTPLLMMIPAAVQGLVTMAIDDLVADLEVSRDAVVLVEIQEATWRSLDYGCLGEQLPGVGDLDISGYRLVLEVDGKDYAYHTDTTNTIRRCDQVDRVVGETEALLEADPVAAELVALAQRRVMRDLSVPLDAITLKSIRAYVWTDASLGCPQPGNDYADVEVDGYRIILVVDDVEYIFHSNFDHLIFCEAGNEVLPEQ